MNKKYKVTIFLEGMYREYLVDSDDLVNKDWNAEVVDMFDSLTKSTDI